MGYPTTLQAISRKLTNDIVIASCGFTRVNTLNFGARMALFNYDNSIVVWSAIPYGDEVIKALKLLTGNENEAFNITHLVIPDREHTLAAKSFKAQYPNMKIIAMESVDLGKDCPIDYTFTSKVGNELIDKRILSENIGIQDSVILNNFEFVYLPSHKNKELVMFDKNSKILFEADLLFNLGVPGSVSGKTKLEQFSTATGYPENFKPHLGKSFLTRYLQPHSKVGNWMANKVTKASDSETKKGLKAIYDWDFEKIVMCHGNIIESDAKNAFKSVFKSALQ